MINQRILVCLLVSVLLTACAAAPMQGEELAALERARQAVAAAAADDQVQRYAAVELEKAQDTLQAAIAAWTEEQNRALAEHLSYMAMRHAQIADAMATEQAASAQAKRIMEQRDKLRLGAKEREIEVLKGQLSELNPKQTAQGIILTLGNVLFAFDSAELTAAANDPLDKLAAFLREHPSYRVRIEGYTDSIGSTAYNQRLSEHRAQSVANAMQARGISPERMTTVGYGESNPVAPNTTEAGRASNRRVEFVILGAGTAASTPGVTVEQQSNIE